MWNTMFDDGLSLVVVQATLMLKLYDSGLVSP